MTPSDDFCFLRKVTRVYTCRREYFSYPLYIISRPKEPWEYIYIYIGFVGDLSFPLCSVVFRCWIIRSTILICRTRIQSGRQTGCPSTLCSSTTNFRKLRRSLFTTWPTGSRNSMIMLSSGR